jgi:hypothetical protein
MYFLKLRYPFRNRLEFVVAKVEALQVPEGEDGVGQLRPVL